jgi:hypothetical protein
MDRIIAERGFESFRESPLTLGQAGPFRPTPVSRQEAAYVASSGSLRHRRMGKTGARWAQGPRHPSQKERDALLRSFDQLSAPEQLRRAPEFRRRLTKLSTSEADCDKCWSRVYVRRLRFIEAHGGTMVGPHRVSATPTTSAAQAARAPRPEPAPKQVSERPRKRVSKRSPQRAAASPARRRPPGAPEFNLRLLLDAGAFTVAWPGVDAAERFTIDVLDTCGTPLQAMSVDGQTTRLRILRSPGGKPLGAARVRALAASGWELVSAEIAFPERGRRVTAADTRRSRVVT